MLQIEIFTSSNINALQKQVNSFLKKIPADAVVNIIQSESPPSNDYGWSATITVVYKEGSNG